MRLAELVAVSERVAATTGRLDKVGLLAELISRLPPDEVPIAVGFLVGTPRQGRLGVGWATLRDVRPETTESSADLSLADVDHAFDRISRVKGKGAAAERQRLIGELLDRATPSERAFLGALALGEVRQGALEGVMADAVAKAAGLPAAAVRRATMLAGDLGLVARVAVTEGAAGLARYRLELFRPVQPMLAGSARDVPEALGQLGRAAFELKLDGARIQVHKLGAEVRVFTRNLNDVTAAVPEVVELIRPVAAERLILDGEVIALAADGRPRPFQETMRRFGRKLDVDALRSELPLTPFFFDLLHAEGEDLLDHPYTERGDRLAAVLSPGLIVTRIVTDRLDPALEFEADALARGHEGVMAKALDAPYAAGRRGGAWLKIKRARTLDLVVVAAEWGSGRRQGWLSNLHLGARDPATGGVVMLGKTFKGMTDEVLAWQTRELLARETGREGRVVRVRPELVVEVAFNEVQESSQYPGGVTLRFARIKGYRPDKSPAEADTIEAVRALRG
jgi:ATP-dependent DNA ligase I